MTAAYWIRMKMCIDNRSFMSLFMNIFIIPKIATYRRKLPAERT